MADTPTCQVIPSFFFRILPLEPPARLWEREPTPIAAVAHPPSRIPHPRHHHPRRTHASASAMQEPTKICLVVNGRHVFAPPICQDKVKIRPPA